MLKYLAPFAVSAAFYFHLLLPSEEPCLLALIVKCLPIYCLAGAVYVRGKSSRSTYDKMILNGLLWSSIGDAFLVWQDLFPLGMVAFAIAHVFYVKAFGFEPLKPFLGLFLFVTAGFVLSQIMPNINDEKIFYGMPVYALFLSTMSWRALVRMSSAPSAWSWPKVTCGLGSILFIISDTTICFHALQEPIPHGQVLIMSTYYAAQLGISLSSLFNAKERKD